MVGVGASAERTEVRITILGRVQGVGYRWFARESATRLGVGGWASNRPDGSVVIEACGLADAIDAFVTSLREGPPHARVKDVRTASRTSAETLPGHFTILR